LSSYIIDNYKKHSFRTFAPQSQQAISRNNAKAIEAIGNDSVYKFFLSKSLLGWAIALATMAIQIWILFIFVEGAEFNLTDDNSDFVYTWKCPRDKEECDNKTDLDEAGWAAFGILLMAAHLHFVHVCHLQQSHCN